MNINDAINRTDDMFPNDFTRDEKIRWLSAIDSLIHREIILKHLNPQPAEFSGYTSDTDENTELLAVEPYSELYISWLESKIHYGNQEYAKYNNSITKFNEEYAAYNRYYTREHTPKPTGLKYY